MVEAQEAVQEQPRPGRKRKSKDEALSEREERIRMKEAQLAERETHVVERELELREEEKSIARRREDGVFLAHLMMHRLSEAELVADFPFVKSVHDPDVVLLYRRMLGRHGLVVRHFEKDGENWLGIYYAYGEDDAPPVDALVSKSLDEMRPWLVDMEHLFVNDPRMPELPHEDGFDRHCRKFNPLPPSMPPHKGAQNILTFMLAEEDDPDNLLKKLGWVQLRPLHKTGKCDPPDGDGDFIRLFFESNEVRDYLCQRRYNLPNGWMVALTPYE